MKVLCLVIFGLVFCACGESQRGDEELTPERVVSDTGLGSFNVDDEDSDVVADATVEVIDALAQPDIDVSVISVDAEPPTPDASPEVDAEPVDVALPFDAGSVEDAEPDSDPDPDAVDAEVEDVSVPDADTPPDAEEADPDADPILDEGVPPVDAAVGEDPLPNQELCPNAGVKLVSITPSDDFPGLLSLSLDYDNEVGTICYEGECFEGLLDPPGVRYPTSLITPRYTVSWTYMPAGQLTSLSISDPNGLVVEISGLFGPPGMPNSPGRYDDHGRHFTGETDVSFDAQDATVVKLPGGAQLTFHHPCRPDRGP